MPAAAVSVIAKSWRHRDDYGGPEPVSHGSVSSGACKSSTLPSGIPAPKTTSNHRSSSIGTRIKEFFKTTVRGGSGRKSHRSFAADTAGSVPPYDTHNQRTSHLPSKQQVERTSTVSQATVSNRSSSSNSILTDLPNGYSCSCSIEVLQRSPRAGSRRTHYFNGIASSNGTLSDIQVSSDEEHRSSSAQHDHHNSCDGHTESSHTDSLCDPWEHSSSTCTSTSSPRLRASSSASQSSRLDEDQRPRRRAYSSPHRRLETDHKQFTPRPRANSSRLPTKSTRVVSPGSEHNGPTSPSSTRPFTSKKSTSTPNRGLHIHNFRSRLPKLKCPSNVSKLNTPSPPASPSKRSLNKAAWQGKKKTKKQVANCGPADYNYDETISTLRYANRAKNIKNTARINEDPKDALLRQYQKEIEMLKQQLEEGGGEHASGEEGSEEEDESEEEEVGPDGQKVKKKKKKKVNISKEKMTEIQRQIEADRKKLEEKKDMEEEEKRKVEQHLAQQETALQKAQEEQEQLNTKLAALEKKIIVGGENLLEKAEAQEKMLEESAKELDDRLKKEEELKKALQEKEQERLDIEEKYSSLQEEVAGKTKKLKKVWTMLMQAKSEIADLQQEHQREMEGLLENVRQLSRELHLQMLIIDNFIPPEYQEMIEQYVHWNEDIGEWQLKCVAYTGNNMRKQTPNADKEKDKFIEPDLSHVYLAYTAEGAEEAMKPKSSKAKKSSRPKTGKSDRPKTSKKKRREQDMDVQ